MNLLLGENLGEIPGRVPARFWPSGLLLPGENHGEIRGRIAPRFWPPGFLLLGENLGEFHGRIPARFWPPGISLPGENLARIPAAKASQDPGPYFTRVKIQFWKKLFAIRFPYKHCNLILTALPTRQDGVENRDKAYTPVRPSNLKVVKPKMFLLGQVQTPYFA